MIKISFLSIITAFSLLLISCTKDVGPNPDLVEKKPEGCDTVTYTKHIKTIIDNNCVSCHSPVGGQSPDLSAYDLIKAQADAERIKARVVDQLPSVMPPSGALPNNEISLIKCWLEAGSPNN